LEEDLSAALRRLLVHQKQKAATPVSVDFHFRDTDAAKALKPKRLLDALSVKTTAAVLGVVDLNPTETQ